MACATCAVVVLAAATLAVVIHSGLIAGPRRRRRDDLRQSRMREPPQLREGHVPFSVGITGLTPFSTTSQLFVTDKDAKPEIVYGPITIPNVDDRGNSCIEVENAPTGLWKVDVVEEGSGFTDSKVFTVEGTEPTTTTASTPPTTTTTTTRAADHDHDNDHDNDDHHYDNDRFNDHDDRCANHNHNGSAHNVDIGGVNDDLNDNDPDRDHSSSWVRSALDHRL